MNHVHLLSINTGIIEQLWHASRNRASLVYQCGKLI